MAISRLQKMSIVIVALMVVGVSILTVIINTDNNTDRTETTTQVTTTLPTTEVTTEVTTEDVSTTNTTTTTTTTTTESTTKKETTTKQTTTKPKKKKTTTTEKETEDNGSEKIYSASYFRRMGVLRWGGWRWTWYSQRVLPGNGLHIPGRHTDDDGYVCDENDYICLASSTLSKGKVLDTPLGKKGKIYDSGCASDTIDVYVNW